MFIRLYTDGGARGNPGPAGIGIVIEDADKRAIIERHGKYIGETTNNQAEYRAVIFGLARCVELGATEVEVVADSELLIKQMTGEYRVKQPALAERYLEVHNLVMRIGRVRWRHVKREYNKEADRLANEAMDLRSM